jgi:hypothetical protein
MSAISYDELDRLAGELLPERTVLGVISTPLAHFGASGASSSSSSAAASSGGNTVVVTQAPGPTVVSACQATNSPGTPGLLGSLGLGSANPGTSMTCIPAAVAG